MFGSKLEGKCLLATTSSVYLELEESLAKHLARDLSEEIGINFVDNSQLCSKSGIEAVNYVDIMILQIILWYVHLYGHVLQASLDGQNVEFWSVVRLMRFTLAEDRKALAAVEIPLQVSIATQAVTLTRDLDDAVPFMQGFLHIDDQPPDANYGFDLPSTVITFPRCSVFKQFQSNDVGHSHILAVIQRQRPMPMYSKFSLMQLATPDFSMPYNVITLMCMVLAPYFGLLLNALRQRIGKEE
ncbi:hypothetical protein SELMODRAFT_429515 [Selaginella moellendorffii]|uniref:GPI transamidase component PIG-T n=1 Tax=Selaginella moellendorffii TaxID=88036 RepID=D8T6F4_SELML|nr:hypothetical protein SELMODRAFT_429515 [Selaginella moellendorffii]